MDDPWPVSFLSSKERKKERKTFLIYTETFRISSRESTDVETLIYKMIIYRAIEFTRNFDSRRCCERTSRTNFTPRLVLPQRRRSNVDPLSKKRKKGKGRRGIIEFPREYGKICCFPREKLTRAGNISRSFSTVRFTYLHPLTRMRAI